MLDDESLPGRGPALDAVVTPTPNNACLTRWPAWRAGSASVPTSGATGRRGADVRGGLRGTRASVGLGEGLVHRFDTGVWASR